MQIPKNSFGSISIIDGTMDGGHIELLLLVINQKTRFLFNKVPVLDVQVCSLILMPKFDPIVVIQQTVRTATFKAKFCH